MNARGHSCKVRSLNENSALLSTSAIIDGDGSGFDVRSELRSGYDAVATGHASGSNSSLYKQALHDHLTGDAVTIAVESFHKIVTSCLLVLLGGVWWAVICCELSTSKEVDSMAHLLVGFLPVWLMCCYTVWRVIKLSSTLCTNPQLTSRSRRAWMRQHLSIATGEAYIDYDSLPLMRRLVCWTTVAVVSLLCYLSFQIMLYLWLIDWIVNFSYLLIPIVAWACAFILYIYVLDVCSTPVVAGF